MAKGKRASGDEPLSKAQEAVQAEVQQAKKVVRQKKVFELPGQIREAPLEGDTLRKFYASLSEQKPECAMAKKWLVQHGCLDREEAEAHLRELVDLGHLKSPAQGKRKRGEEGDSPVRRPRTQAAGKAGSQAGTPQARRKPAAKPKAPAKPPSQKKAAAKRPSSAKAESSAEESDSESEQDTPLAKRAQKSAAAKPSKPSSNKKAAVEYESESEDSAGDADSSDADSQDRVPLAKRM